MSEKIKGNLEKCIADSFDQEDDVYKSNNALLNSNKNSQEYSGFYLVPAIFINNNLVKENLEIDLTISAICDKFINGPQIC